MGGNVANLNEFKGMLGGAFCEICCQIAGKVLQKQQKRVKFQNFRLQRAVALALCTKLIKVGDSRRSAPLQKFCAGSMPD